MIYTSTETVLTPYVQHPMVYVQLPFGFYLVMVLLIVAICYSRETN